MNPTVAKGRAGMAKKNAKSIEDLLSEREQFTKWLSRLDENADQASDKVRDKIRGDYQTRLEAIMEELGSHSDSIAEQLADHRGTQEDLTARETSAREERAEAEMRHTVGEYDDDEWNKLKEMADEQLEKIGSDLTGVTDEIERLAGVQALIASRPDPAEEAAAAAEADASVISISVGDDADSEGGEESEEGEESTAMGAPKFTPRGTDTGGESSAPRTLRFPGADVKEDSLNELDFLKSVSDEDSAGAATEDEPASAEPESAPDVAPSATETDSGGQTQAKTLKCAECGELNRPTEWYCERCGAELASL